MLDVSDPPERDDARDLPARVPTPGVGALIASDCAKRRDVEGVSRGVKLRWFFDPGFCAAVVLRLSTGCHARGHLRLARFLSALDSLWFKIQFDPATRVGPRFMLRRAMGVVLLEAPTLGQDVVLSEMVIIGDFARRAPVTPTIIGNGVVMEPGSCVVAGSNVGDGCVIGANSFAEGHIPAQHEVIGTELRPRQGSVPQRPEDSCAPNPPSVRTGLCATLDLVASDVKRRAADKRKSVLRVVLELPLTPALLAGLAYRIGHYCWGHHLRSLAHIIRFSSVVWLSSDIHPAAHIGPALLMSHSVGTSVGPGVTMGPRAFLCPHSSIDRRAFGAEAESAYPVIGTGTFVGNHSYVLGRSRTGAASLVGGGTTIADETFGDSSLIAGVPATSRPLDGRFDDPSSWAPEPERPSAADAAAEGTTATWRQMRLLMRSDRLAWTRARDAHVEAGFTPGARPFARVAQTVLRLQNYLHASGHLLTARALFMWNLATFGLEIPQGITIGPRFRMTGCFGSCMRNEVIIGSDVTIGAAAGVGDNLGKIGMPVIHPGATLRSGVRLHGPVDIGRDTIVGPNTVLMRSVPAGYYKDPKTQTELA